MSKTYSLTVIQYPSLRWGFVGSVPAHLAYVDADGRPVSSETIRKQLMLPSAYRTIKTRTFETREAALAAAKESENE